MRDSSAINFSNMSLHVAIDSTKEQDMTGTAAVPLPTLAAILACREASPRIMEHEKAILVMKEHDYAKTPDMSQLAPLFHLLTGQAGGNDARPRRSKPLRKGSGGFNVRQALADVRMKLLNEGGAMSDHLTRMVSLQAILIQQLQEQVFFKGLETTTIKREKEQLEARLERMERRMSILQKRSKHQLNEIETDDTTHLDATPTSQLNASPTPRTPNQAKPEPLTRLARSESTTSRKSRSRSSSTERVGGKRHSRTSSITNSLEVTHKARKRGPEGTGGVASSKKVRSSSPIEEHVITEQHYEGLGVSVVEHPLSLETPADDQTDDKSVVKVPSWKISPPVTHPDTSSPSITEDTSDESFAKRHGKQESEEKRRKRWDTQRMRERLHHNQLLKRYMLKEGCSPQPEKKKKDKITSFLPKLEDIEAIEITDTLIVNAFGKPIPNIKPTTFQLPNFDPTSPKNTRGKLKGRMSTQLNSS